MTAWLSFSCCDGEHVCHGERFAEVVAAVASGDQAAAVGVNCTPPQYVESLIGVARTATDKPIVVYPNSGEAWMPVRAAGSPARAEPTSARRRVCGARQGPS